MEYLRNVRLHTPALRSFKLLFYFFASHSWGHRNVALIKDALLLSNGSDEVVVSVLELLKRSYRYQGHGDIAANGQYPPYFHEAVIERSTDTDNHQREH